MKLWPDKERFQVTVEVRREVCKTALLPFNQEDGFYAIIFVATVPVSQTQAHTRTHARACAMVYTSSVQKEKRDRNIKRLSKQTC